MSLQPNPCFAWLQWLMQWFHYFSPVGDDRPFVKSGPFQFAQMCLRLCPNLIPCMEVMREVLNLDPSKEDRLSPVDFWGTIEGLLRIIRVFKHVSFAGTIYLLPEKVIETYIMQRDELSFCQEMTERCDSMLRSRLSRIADRDSPGTIQYVQVMITLHAGFPSVASITDCREWPALISTLAFGAFPEIDDTLRIHHCLESAETLHFLSSFQSDPTRSGIFYTDTEVQNAFVTSRLIQSLSSYR